MMPGEQNDTVLRLRRGADAVEPALRPGQVDDVLDQVLTRRARQRAQRMRLWGAAAAVVVVVAGTVVVGGELARQNSQVEVATAVDQWPLRGDLAGDAALLSRAEGVWREAKGPYAPVGQVRPLYAQRSPSMLVNLVVVVLTGWTADGRAVVAFVTSPATDGEPDGSRLLVRAVTLADATQPAVGFVASGPDPADTPGPTNWGSLAFALAAPGLRGVTVSSSVVDDNYTETSSSEVYWRILPSGVGAWNSVIRTRQAGDRGQSVWPAAATHGPVATPVMVHDASGGAMSVQSPSQAPAIGDLVVTPEALLGVVTDATGRIDTAPTSWAAYGTVRTAVSRIPGTLTAVSANVLLFTPTGPGEIADGNRLEFTSTTSPDVVVSVGRLTRTDAGWRVDRAVDPSAVPTVALSVSPH